MIAFVGQSEGRELARLFSSVHWIAVTDERVRTVWEAEYRRWRAAFVRLFQVLADELGNGVDPRPLGDAVAAAADGLAAVKSLNAEVDGPAVVRALVRGLATAAAQPAHAAPL